MLVVNKPEIPPVKKSRSLVCLIVSCKINSTVKIRMRLPTAIFNNCTSTYKYTINPAISPIRLPFISLNNKERSISFLIL